MIDAFRLPGDRRWYRLALGALIVVAWGSLVLWGASPFAGLLGHRDLGDDRLPGLLRVGVFLLGWTLMTVAMMLPSSLPLVNLFRRFVFDRADGPRLLALLLVGYLGVWVEFGLLIYVADGLLHAAVARIDWLAAASTAIGAAVLLVAGLYQFTPLKMLCLDKCRSPLGFLIQHWRGKHPGRDALRLGVRHGLFCLGCCWTLMLLMFAVGGANVGWMLALGALMAAERTTRWGRRLSRPLGAALILGSLLVLGGLAPFPSA